MQPALPSGLPPQVQERISCSLAAAARYEVPANIMLAVAEKEAPSGRIVVASSDSLL